MEYSIMWRGEFYQAQFELYGQATPVVIYEKNFPHKVVYWQHEQGGIDKAPKGLVEAVHSLREQLTGLTIVA
jgi:hypothetical protein